MTSRDFNPAYLTLGNNFCIDYKLNHQLSIPIQGAECCDTSSYREIETLYKELQYLKRFIMNKGLPDVKSELSATKAKYKRLLKKFELLEEKVDGIQLSDTTQEVDLSAIEGMLDDHAGLHSGHTASLGDHAVQLSGHSESLGDQATTLGDHSLRLSALEVSVAAMQSNMTVIQEGADVVDVDLIVINNTLGDHAQLHAQHTSMLSIQEGQIGDTFGVLEAAFDQPMGTV